MISCAKVSSSEYEAAQLKYMMKVKVKRYRYCMMVVMAGEKGMKVNSNTNTTTLTKSSCRELGAWLEPCDHGVLCCYT